MIGSMLCTYMHLHVDISLPMNVPKKNGSILTPITGDAKFINQFGSIGVIRKNIM